MRISRIEMTKPHIDPEQRVCRADVALYLGAPEKPTDQAVHLKCKSIVSGSETAQQLLDGLLLDALRQMLDARIPLWRHEPFGLTHDPWRGNPVITIPSKSGTNRISKPTLNLSTGDND